MSSRHRPINWAQKPQTKEAGPTQTDSLVAYLETPPALRGLGRVPQKPKPKQEDNLLKLVAKGLSGLDYITKDTKPKQPIRQSAAAAQAEFLSNRMKR